ncbi:hypothetical protein AMD27_17350 (plasmid) [Acinetobacter sp. TGL-Y2]|uniref:hypothetical protein n=1 Tax=Acinetobacter sp. TGL-Y2 TaxID=1407071 RepID=UPI0007A65D99|nr:hypothetical protein [Acinetobacter sp. TGL-Y2]AMW80683.1 hypothetical protein AMD27_17350 [Acinetobacter sp. TGL-Y2]
MKSTHPQIRIVCPECEGQLALWQEMAIVYSRKIDPKTGDIKPRITKSEIESTDLHGLKCTVCDWNASSNDFSEEAQEISEMINQDQFEIK